MTSIEDENNIFYNIGDLCYLPKGKYYIRAGNTNICDRCNIKFANPDLLSWHRKLCNSNVCVICFSNNNIKSFSDPNEYKEHTKTHTEEFTQSMKDVLLSEKDKYQSNNKQENTSFFKKIGNGILTYYKTMFKINMSVLNFVKDHPEVAKAVFMLI